MMIVPEHVLAVFAAFGGLFKLARAAGVPPTTASHWKRERRIPTWRVPQIVKGARDEGLIVTEHADGSVTIAKPAAGGAEAA